MDNDPIHKSAFVKDFCVKEKVTIYFAVPGDSRGNPIELYFGWIKKNIVNEIYTTKEELAQVIVK